MANWEWGVFPAMTVMILFFVPFYVRRQISTMPEWLEHRFGPSSRFTFAIIIVLSYVFINLAGVLYAGGLALHTIFGINLWHAIIHAGRGDGACIRSWAACLRSSGPT